MLAVMRPVALATAALLSMGLFQGAVAQTPDGELLFETCLGCHGIPGYKNNYPTYKVPMLAGQSEQYIVDALTAYKNGMRKHETMHAQASSFSTDDMRAIGAYLSGLKDVSGETTGKAPAAAAACSACHGPNGKAIAPNFPSLAGQHADYLEFSLKRYRSGERNNAIMAGFAGNLDDDTIKALAAYFSSQRDGLATVGD